MDGYAIDFLKEINRPNITYITPESKQYVHEVLPDYFGFFMPYYDNEKENISYVDFVVNNKSQIPSKNTALFAHLYDDTSKSGSEADIITKYISNINFEEFSKYFHQVISGHIHKKQAYLKNKMQVTYPGNFQSFGRHDIDLDKSYVIMDSSGALEEVPTKHIMYIRSKVSSIEENIPELDANKKFVIYLDIKGYSGMNSMVMDYLDSQYKLNPNILNIIINNSTSRTIDITSAGLDDYETLSLDDLITAKIKESTDKDEIEYLINLFGGIRNAESKQ